MSTQIQPQSELEIFQDFYEKGYLNEKGKDRFLQLLFKLHDSQEELNQKPSKVKLTGNLDNPIEDLINKDYGTHKE